MAEKQEKGNHSKQGRFGETDADKKILSDPAALWSSFVELGKSVVGGCPPAGDAHSMDRYMQGLMARAPILPGMVAKTAAAYASRSWSILGGRNTVRRTAQILKDADDGKGWYPFCEALATSFLTRNMGSFAEMQRRYAPVWSEAHGWQYELSQVVQLYNMDSTKVRWRRSKGHVDEDFPISFERRVWGRYDFFHLVSWPWDTDELRNVGRCGLYRSLEALRLMVLINDWEQGSLDPGRLDALLLLSGAEQEQVGGAFTAMEQAVQDKGAAAKRLGVIANMNGEVKGDLFFLRRRPESLENFEERIRMLLELYAMNLGKDITFYFPSSYGSLLGRSGTEVRTIEKAAEESNVFHPKLQENLQRWVIPRTLHFEFDGNSVSEEEDNARLYNLSRTAKNLFTATRSDEKGLVENLVTRDELRQLMADKDADRFGDWTVDAEEVTATADIDVRSLSHLRETPAAAELIDGYRAGRYRDDELVRYSWHRDHMKGVASTRQVDLGLSVAELARKRVF